MYVWQVLEKSSGVYPSIFRTRCGGECVCPWLRYLARDRVASRLMGKLNSTKT